MRLWHKDLIPVLPRQQLISQWRECCAIAGSIAKNKTPNHILVNKVLESRGDFYSYSMKVVSEIKSRGYTISSKSMDSFIKNLFAGEYKTNSTHFNIFPQWFTRRYLIQCIANLSEKYDCGGISEKEWEFISSSFSDIVSLF